MRRLHDIPIRRKLVIIFLMTTAAAMVSVRVTFLVREYFSHRETIRQQTAMVAGIVASNSSGALAFENAADAKDILSGLRANPHITGAALYDRAGRVFATYPDGRAASEFPTVPRERGYRFSDGVLYGYEAVNEGGRELGTLFLEINTKALLRDWLLSSVVLASLLMLGMLAVTYVISQKLMRHLSDPILLLAATARAVSKNNDYRLRTSVTGGDELGQLASDFNDMLGRIDAQDRTIREASLMLEQRVAERTAQLQEANHELESFSYSVSHDLRAPLRHINGYVQLLDKESGAKLTDKERRYLEIVAKSARSMGVLIDELLAFSKMGRTEMRRVPFDMRAMVEEIVQEQRAEFPHRRIDWRMGELPTVEADPAMLRQVWRNLIGNAVKYSAKRDLAVIEIDCRRDEHALVFNVRDNGAGFDMKYAEKLFGVFQRLHSVQEFEGTGIGLANVRRIVQRHGGKTWADAQVDHGATFHFSLPLPKSPKP